MNETPFISRSELDADRGGCRQAELFLHLYVEGELDPIRSRSLSAHLESCAACRAVRREMERERLWLLESTVIAPPLSEHFREKVITLIQKDRAAASAQRRREVFFRATGAAAAVFILACAAFHSLEESGMAPEAYHETARVVLPPSPGAARPASIPVRLVSLSLPDPQDAWRPSGEWVDCIDDEAPEYASGAGPDGEGSGGPEDSSPWGPNIGEVVRMAAEINASFPRRIAVPEDDPCRPDPNRDGRAGYDDIVSLLQTALRGHHHHFLGGGPDGAALEDCRDLCVRRAGLRLESGS